LLAPHRLGFFLGVFVLVFASGWWMLVQWSRLVLAGAMSYAISPTLVHASVMVLGFFPLFFSGFLFTAGPKWLHVAAPTARQLLIPLLLQAAGWLTWLTGAHLHEHLALVGVALATLGLCWVTAIFWRLLLRSQMPDRVHARLIALACTVGCLSLIGFLASLLWGTNELARAWVYTALWGCVLLVFVTVSHRMIPFFTSSAIPMVASWRPFWLLWLMVSVLTLETASVWLQMLLPARGMGGTWQLVQGGVELLVGTLLVWLTGVWGLVQSLKNRLLAMLHIGFAWLGLSILLSGATRLLALWLQTPVLPLGALHATTMGCLGSLTLAMVTRVSCGHSGRALVADNGVWLLFWALQCATLMRIAASVTSPLTAWLLPATALLWLTVVTLWGTRLGSWYGRVRTDGKPG
jgi:uncharacterized protein involved in response to NO